jgi:uncharacterized protein YkwD
MKTLATYAVLAATLLCCACTEPIAGLPSGEVNNAARLEMVRWHNDLRSEQELNPLSTDARLMAIAQQQAEYNAFKGRLEHQDAAGGFVADRAAASGYTGHVVENLGYALSATAVFSDWQASPPHFAPMLRSDFRAIGVGRARSGIYEFWCVVFGDI